MRSHDEEIEVYVQRILESFGESFSAAKVYAKLLVSGAPATIDELARATGLGRSTVAAALRVLEHDGLVYYEKRGRRKLYYARSALHRLLLFPVRLLHEYIVPLRRLLEERARERGDEWSLRLLEEVRELEEAARSIEELVSRRLRGALGED